MEGETSPEVAWALKFVQETLTLFLQKDPGHLTLASATQIILLVAYCLSST